MSVSALSMEARETLRESRRKGDNIAASSSELAVDQDGRPFNGLCIESLYSPLVVDDSRAECCCELETECESELSRLSSDVMDQ